MKIQKSLISLLFFSFFSCSTNNLTRELDSSIPNNEIKVLKVNEQGTKISFGIKFSTGLPSVKGVSEIDHFEVYLLKNKSLDGYPVDGSPELDKVVGPFSVGLEKMNDLQFSGIGSSNGEAYYIAVRAVNNSGQDLIKENELLTSSNKKYSISSDKGIVVDSNLKVNSNESLSVIIQLQEAYKTKIESNLKVNDGNVFENKLKSKKRVKSLDEELTLFDLRYLGEYHYDIDMNNNGRSVISWSDPFNSYTNILIYDEKGQQVTPMFILDSPKKYDSSNSEKLFDSKVSINENGDFAIAWDTNEKTYDSEFYDFFNSNEAPFLTVKKYDKNGNPLGDEIPIEYSDKSYTSYYKHDLKMKSDGSFSIVWIGSKNNLESSLFLRNYDKNGKPLGNEIKIYSFNFSSIGQDSHPKILIDSFENMIIYWIDADGETNLITPYIKRYDKNGSPIGEKVNLINSFGSSNMHNYDFAVDSSGNIISAWVSLNSSSNLKELYIIKYDFSTKSFDKKTLIFSPDSDSMGYFSVPKIAIDSRDNITIFWQNFTYKSNLYEDPKTLIGRKLNKDFEVVFDYYANHDAYNPRILMNKKGNFIFTRQNFGLQMKMKRYIK